jgi:hypothetical protein
MARGPEKPKKKLLEWSQIDVCAYLHNFFLNETKWLND